MTARVLWSGLAVVDASGKAVIWRGSDAPKLYRSEEQGAHARTDGSDLVPVTLMVGRIAPAAEHVANAVLRAIGGKPRRTSASSA